VDVGGYHSIGAGRRVLAPDGTLVGVGAGKGATVPVLAGVVSAYVRRRLLKQRVVGFLAEVTKDDLLFLKGLIEAGKLRPVIDRTYPLTETAEAMRYTETGRARGKVVVTVSGGAAASGAPA
jgi:NADPH:quinone reductase-like Zn-dependent oxidoreductase